MLDDFSRYILAWQLCTTMTAADVTETLRLALNAAGLNSTTVQQRPGCSAITDRPTCRPNWALGWISTA